jgi:hypothetical protein
LNRPCAGPSPPLLVRLERAAIMAKSSPFDDDVLSGSDRGVVMHLLTFPARLGMQGPLAWTGVVVCHETWN